MWNFKGTLWNSTQNILPIHWKICFLYNIEILRAHRFKSSYAFLKRPPRLLFYQRVLADLILAGSADPRIPAEPICNLSREISADPIRISWANPDQHPLRLTLKLLPFVCFAYKQTETHSFQQIIWQNQSRKYLPFSQPSISNGCHLINNGKWVYFHFVCACMAFFSDTNCHCDVTVESPCAQPWQPFKGPSVFPGRDIVVWTVWTVFEQFLLKNIENRPQWGIGTVNYYNNGITAIGTSAITYVHSTNPGTNTNTLAITNK